MLVISTILLIAVMGFYCVTRGVFAAVDSAAGHRGTRFVTCPELSRPAVVSIAIGTLTPEGYRVLDRMRIGECSNWPARQNCAQECLKQIE